MQISIVLLASLICFAAVWVMKERESVLTAPVRLLLASSLSIVALSMLSFVYGAQTAVMAFILVGAVMWMAVSMARLSKFQFKS
ncbi:hypothetical protein G3R49_14240 [Shewanella sp. WXL01]|uniref:hypothetical protein n=1 Tax=Shewanella sp. WXL01 TaxID=2709721 RepID=UPI00143831C9|nr:hypothetical protein [Shewanella sp. WXL01]NKF51722.1 hypothetical protein [Shewanella sp. WXL01]